MAVVTVLVYLLLYYSQDLREKSLDLKTRVIPEAETRSDEVEAKRDTLLKAIGNLVHPSVPISNDEANNQVAMCREI